VIKNRKLFTVMPVGQKKRKYPLICCATPPQVGHRLTAVETLLPFSLITHGHPSI